jgi:hypothetical protein
MQSNMNKLLTAIVWYAINMAVGLFPVLFLLVVKLFGFDQDINRIANVELTNLLAEFFFSFVSCGIAFAVSFDAYSIKLKIRRPYDLVAVVLLMIFIGATSVPFLVTIFAHANMDTAVLITSQIIMTVLTAAYSITIKFLMS